MVDKFLFYHLSARIARQLGYEEYFLRNLIIGQLSFAKRLNFSRADFFRSRPENDGTSYDFTHNRIRQPKNSHIQDLRMQM